VSCGEGGRGASPGCKEVVGVRVLAREIGLGQRTPGRKLGRAGGTVGSFLGLVPFLIGRTFLIRAMASWD
jgi:hypothetical protein